MEKLELNFNIRWKTSSMDKQLPDYSQWRKFTVDNVDPVKRFKRIDNATSAIRSAGKIQLLLYL